MQTLFEMRKEKGEPTPNRVQSSSLELPRCEGGKDHEVGLKEKGEMRKAMRMIISFGVYLLNPSRLLVPRLLVY